MASPFSFHCMICIEEFDQRDRYPVVLPCGHTYVCNQCAERLTKCMECREPLLIPIPQESKPAQPMLNYRPAANLPSDRTRGRLQQSGIGSNNSGQRQSGTQNRPAQVQKKRLPLPKNVVLMSLMDATEAVTATPAIVPPVSSLSSPMTSPSRKVTKNSRETMMDEEEQEEEKIRFSTSLAASACGTYVVTCKEGMHIFPSKPEENDGDGANDVRTAASNNQTAGENDDIDAMVRFFHLDHKMALNAKDCDADRIAAINSTTPVQLSKGDRVQIVSIDGGWAKLARGYGYVRAGSGQVAKVGGSVDRACKLEALLRSVSLRRKQLREEQRKADCQSVTLMQDLQTSLLSDEDLTVIGADTFTDVVPKSSRDEENENSCAPAKQPPGSPSNDDDVRDTARGRSISPDAEEEEENSVADLKPHRMIRVDSPTNIVPTSLGCFSQDFFGDCGAVSTPTRPTSESVRELSASAMGNARMIAGFMGALSFSDENSITAANNSSGRLLAAPHPSPRAMSAGARAWREQHNRPASSAIDFRTGMSGHMALLSTHTVPSTSQYLPSSRGTISSASLSWGRMSDHTGLSSSRRHLKASPPPSPNTNPTNRSYDYTDSASTI